MRPFLPPLLAGALARGDAGLDFDGTSFSFLESAWFLVLVLALAVLSYAVDRARSRGAQSASDAAGGRDVAEAVVLAISLALGALLFAGSLAEGGRASWPGVLAGAACALVGWLAVAALFRAARRRLDPGAAALLPAWADVVALAVAGLAILFPPLGFVALAAFVALGVLRSRESGRKYAGLRILR